MKGVHRQRPELWPLFPVVKVAPLRVQVRDAGRRGDCGDAVVPKARQRDDLRTAAVVKQPPVLQPRCRRRHRAAIRSGGRESPSPIVL